MNDYYTADYTPLGLGPTSMEVGYTPSKERQDVMQSTMQPTYAPRSSTRSATRSATMSPEVDYPADYQPVPRAVSDFRQNPNHPHSYMNQSRRRNMTEPSMDFAEIVKRGLKYIIEGVAVAVVAYVLLKDRLKLTTKDILILAFTAAFTFAILDTFAPTISLGAKLGAGFGLG